MACAVRFRSGGIARGRQAGGRRRRGPAPHGDRFERARLTAAEAVQTINGVGLGPNGSLIGVGYDELILDLTGSLAN
jgi:hypothetical protein